MPVTIPPFTNVPAPNDPVASAWAQQLTQFAVDQIQAGPTAPTNPDAELWYDTSDSGAMFPTGGPRGLMGWAQRTSDSTQSYQTQKEISGLNVSFTAYPNRIYRTSVTLTVRHTANGGITFGISDVTEANSLKRVGMMASAGIDTPLTFFHIESGLSGALVRRAVLYTGVAGTTTIVGASAYNPQIVVEDIGGT